MRPHFLVPALALLGSASAADYSKTLWSYVTGSVKATPLMESRVMGQIVIKIWAMPPGLPVEGIEVIYMPKVNQAHWAVKVTNPQVKANVMLGAQQLTFVKIMTDPKRTDQKMNVFRVGDGMFRNMYLAEGTLTDRSGTSARLLMLLTPQMLDRDTSPLELLK
ncbi:hypothetical protein [Deinococcus koreensis]|uniref:Uncharacterized protein n=1 Tax=Deinococcus koreensis TaxID=2054903 RepID=A0A2K3V172_9DEIO|nr:hypothetical protein [Deinococcus koreensis]PNY82535.1 hypothetical protein CVO96_15315 [Deinococcus koreensis]